MLCWCCWWYKFNQKIYGDYIYSQLGFFIYFSEQRSVAGQRTKSFSYIMRIYLGDNCVGVWKKSRQGRMCVAVDITAMPSWRKWLQIMGKEAIKRYGWWVSVVIIRAEVVRFKAIFKVAFFKTFTYTYKYHHTHPSHTHTSVCWYFYIFTQKWCFSTLQIKILI